MNLPWLFALYYCGKNTLINCFIRVFCFKLFFSCFPYCFGTFPLLSYKEYTHVFSVIITEIPNGISISEMT